MKGTDKETDNKHYPPLVLSKRPTKRPTLKNPPRRSATGLSSVSPASNQRKSVASSPEAEHYP